MVKLKASLDELKNPLADDSDEVVTPTASVAPVVTVQRVVARRITVAIDGRLVTLNEGSIVTDGVDRLAALGVAFREA